MNLYLDDNLAGASLATHLRHAGHVVVLPVDAGTAGDCDAQHLTHAAAAGQVCVTEDHEDYLHLHLLVKVTGGRHSGILVVRRDNDPKRDMKDRHIVRALANLEAAGVPIANEFHILNHWR